MKKEDRKKKLELLIEKQKAKINENYGTLFDECIVALGDGVTIFSENKSEELYYLFEEHVPFTEWVPGKKGPYRFCKSCFRW